MAKEESNLKLNYTPQKNCGVFLLKKLDMKYIIVIFLLCLFANYGFSQKKKFLPNKRKVEMVTLKMAKDEDVGKVPIVDSQNQYAYLDENIDAFGELRKIFSSNIYEYKNIKINLDSFDNWFPQIVDSFTSRKNEYKIPSQLNISSIAVSNFVAFNTTFFNKSLFNRTKADFETAKDLASKINDPLSKIWATLQLGIMYENVNRRPLIYDSICIAFAKETEKYFKVLLKGKEKSIAYEYLGDFYNEFKFYSEAIENYTKAIEQKKRFSLDKDFYNLFLKKGFVYTDLNFNNDFVANTNIFFNAIFTTPYLGKGYYETSSFYNYYDYYNRFKNKDSIDTIKHAKLALHLYKYKLLDEKIASSNLFELIAELFYQKGEYYLAANVLKRNLLESVFESSSKPAYNQIAITLGFLNNCYTTLKTDTKFGIANHLDNFILNHGSEYENFYRAKDKGFLYLNEGNLTEASKIMYSMNYQKYDTIFAPRYTEILKKDWNFFAREYYFSKLQTVLNKRDSTLKNLIDSLVNNEMQIAANNLRFKNYQINALSAENYVNQKWLLDAYNELDSIKEVIQKNSWGFQVLKVVAERKEVDARYSDSITQEKNAEFKINIEKAKIELSSMEISVSKANDELDFTKESYKKLNDSLLLKSKYFDLLNRRLDSLQKTYNNIDSLRRIAIEDAIDAKTTRNWASGFALLSLLAFVIFFIASSKQKKLSKKLKIETKEMLEKVELDNNFNTEKLKSTRLELEASAASASLNPHFIKGIISTFETDYEKINDNDKRAFNQNLKELVNKTYKLSQASSTTLYEEIDCIMHLVKNYNYTTHKDCTVNFSPPENWETNYDCAMLKLPPLVIFNLVENSLTKAFTDKEYKCKNISVEIVDDDLTKSIIVTDNGKGFNINTVKKGGLEKNDKLLNYFNSINDAGNKLKCSFYSQETNNKETKIILQYE